MWPRKLPFRAMGADCEKMPNRAGGAPVGTMLRQAAELGSAVHDPGKLWDAVKSGASPLSIGMGIYYGSFR